MPGRPGVHAAADQLRGKVAPISRNDRVAIVFCGTKKSLATGVPMATVLFAGQPVGLIVFPLMVFHMLQLMACSLIAQRWAGEHTGDLNTPA